MRLGADLFLTRELKQAQLVRVPTSPAVVDEFLKLRRHRIEGAGVAPARRG